MLGIFRDKFPELKKNDIYIAGESYGGIFVPRLVEQIDWYNSNCTANDSCDFKPNLKGFIVANGLTDYKFDNIFTLYDMAFWYGILDTTDYKNIKKYCFTENQPPQCAEWLRTVDEAFDGINMFDAFGVCYNETSKMEPYTSKYHELIRSGNDIRPVKSSYTALDFAPFLVDSLGSNVRNLKMLPPCMYTKLVVEYMNNATVKAALHVPADAPVWDFCSDSVNKNYNKSTEGSIGIYQRLKDKYKILKISGDTDLAVSIFATKGWIENQTWPITKEWHKYMVDG